MIMTRQAFLVTSGIDGQMLEFWLEQQWLIPQDGPDGPAFSDGDVARAHFILDLKRDFGVNDEGVGLVLHLVDQLHGMRRAFALLKNEMSAGRSDL
ncbi:chaperone modulatory protein CbpM [Rhodoblastus acidophilus]|uniref:chaperone modulator CbpM n=1 Tax=Rhodoblastus acidophilus TaxID=1074 RepID=UPI00183A814B|nr:chaperone modulator CbpM [Rhodoblastus acidophilus]MCW2286480.1 chaperone modulatory protein CbpM [Rhodoblastus acidophilus]MCW2335332.1 chaperone modulatory protein CbpM [Rhodoblastus acidophilus]